MIRSFLSKEEFMNKYAKSDSTYNRRITELRNNPDFCDAYVAVTEKEIWIIEEIYQEFLVWKSKNKYLVGGNKK